MTDQHYHHHDTIIPGKAPPIPTASSIGYALLPLWLSILFFIFFVVSGKLIL